MLLRKCSSRPELFCCARETGRLSPSFCWIYIAKIADFREEKPQDLHKAPGIIRNRIKINATLKLFSPTLKRLGLTINLSRFFPTSHDTFIRCSFFESLESLCMIINHHKAMQIFLECLISSVVVPFYCCCFKQATHSFHLTISPGIPHLG